MDIADEIERRVSVAAEEHASLWGCDDPECALIHSNLWGELHVEGMRLAEDLNPCHPRRRRWWQIWKRR